MHLVCRTADSLSHGAEENCESFDRRAGHIFFCPRVSSIASDMSPSARARSASVYDALACYTTDVRSRRTVRAAAGTDHVRNAQD